MKRIVRKGVKMIKKYFRSKQGVIILIIIFLLAGRISAQFLDEFNDTSITLDSSALNGWTFYTGDGLATMKFQQKDGYASIFVDATKDQRGIWWALIRRCVSADFDLSLLTKSNYDSN